MFSFMVLVKHAEVVDTTLTYCCFIIVAAFTLDEIRQVILNIPLLKSSLTGRYFKIFNLKRIDLSCFLDLSGRAVGHAKSHHQNCDRAVDNVLKIS